MEPVRAYIGPVRFHYTMATGVRPVYISANANLEGVKEQIKLLWGFETVDMLGIKHEDSPFLQGDDTKLCDYIIGNFKFQYMDDKGNEFTVVGTDSSGLEKTVKYKFFHTFAYGGLFMVNKAEFDEFLAVPKYGFLQELNPEPGQPKDRGLFGRGMDSVNVLLRERSRQAHISAEQEAAATVILSKERLGQQLLTKAQLAAFFSAVTEVGLEDPTLTTQQLVDAQRLAKQETKELLKQADRKLDAIFATWKDRIAKAASAEDELYRVRRSNRDLAGRVRALIAENDRLKKRKREVTDVDETLLRGAKGARLEDRS